MELTSTRTVPAPLETTWAALNDPETLKACLPGCESFERSGENEFQASMTARVGPVSARFSGRIRLSDIVPPRSYTISFEGQGGAAGFARGEARVALDAQDGGTRIEYAVKAQVGGKLAQIGSRLIDGAAAKVADDFFARLVERLTPPGAVAPQAAAVSEAAARWRRMWLRLAIAAAIIVVIAVYWLTRAA
jgi:carbon monoxide dehydrogenase subunit G